MNININIDKVQLAQELAKLVFGKKEVEQDLAELALYLVIIGIDFTVLPDDTKIAIVGTAKDNFFGFSVFNKNFDFEPCFENGEGTEVKPKKKYEKYIRMQEVTNSRLSRKIECNNWVEYHQDSIIPNIKLSGKFAHEESGPYIPELIKKMENFRKKLLIRQFLKTLNFEHNLINNTDEVTIKTIDGENNIDSSLLTITELSKKLEHLKNKGLLEIILLTNNSKTPKKWFYAEGELCEQNKNLFEHSKGILSLKEEIGEVYANMKNTEYQIREKLFSKDLKPKISSESIVSIIKKEGFSDKIKKLNKKIETLEKESQKIFARQIRDSKKILVNIKKVHEELEEMKEKCEDKDYIKYNVMFRRIKKIAVNKSMGSINKLTILKQMCKNAATKKKIVPDSITIDGEKIKEVDNDTKVKIQQLYAMNEIKCKSDAVYKKNGVIVKSPMYFGSTETIFNKDRDGKVVSKTLVLSENEILGNHQIRIRNIPMWMPYEVLLEEMRKDLPKFIEGFFTGNAATLKKLAEITGKSLQDFAGDAPDEHMSLAITGKFGAIETDIPKIVDGKLSFDPKELSKFSHGYEPFKNFENALIACYPNSESELVKAARREQENQEDIGTGRKSHIDMINRSSATRINMSPTQ